MFLDLILKSWQCRPSLVPRTVKWYGKKRAWYKLSADAQKLPRIVVIFFYRNLHRKTTSSDVQIRFGKLRRAEHEVKKEGRIQLRALEHFNKNSIWLPEGVAVLVDSFSASSFLL